MKVPPIFVFLENLADALDKFCQEIEEAYTYERKIKNNGSILFKAQEKKKIDLMTTTNVVVSNNLAADLNPVDTLSWRFLMSNSMFM